MKKYSKELLEHRKNKPISSDNFVGKIRAKQMMYSDYVKKEKERKNNKI